MLKTHTLPRPQGLIEVDTVLDVGAGIRPMQWYVPRSHVCVEPYEPYADALVASGMEVIRKTALEAFRTGATAEAIYMLDVIEHMPKHVGLAVLKAAMAAATRQVVVFTPYGFVPQTKDAWEMGGELWQMHRSGWLPSDFPGWDIEVLRLDDEEPASFFAVLTK